MKKYIKKSIPVILTIVAIIPSYHLFYLSRQKKDLSIVLTNVVYHDSLSSINNKIKITEPITVLNFEIENNGNLPLQASDFSTALTFNTNKNEILDSKVYNSLPDNLHLEFERIYKNQIKMKSRLFNQGEKFSLQIITKNRIDSLFVDCRIVGVDKLELDNESNSGETVLLFKDLENNCQLKIIKATYGFAERTIDMTDSLNLKIKNDTLIVKATCEVDPYRNKVKSMNIKYIFRGFVDTVSIKESEMIILP